MEVDQKLDQSELRKMEVELMSDCGEEDEEVAAINQLDEDCIIDSPYPSDDECEEFLVTDSLQERIIFIALDMDNIC